jgi:hypothetical protein
MNESYELRACAIHEAAHAVIAEALAGGTARVSIQRRQDAGNVWFTGQCEHVAGTTLHDQNMIALAGAVAEVLLHRDRYANGPSLLRAIAQHISTSDARHSNTAAQDDVEDAIKLVLRHRTSIEERADAEIVRFSAPNSMSPATIPDQRRAVGSRSSSADGDDVWLNNLLAQQPSLRDTWLFGSRTYPRGMEPAKAPPWVRALAEQKMRRAGTAPS